MSRKAKALLWEIWRLGQRETITRAGVLLAALGFLALGIVQRNIGSGPAELVIRSIVILIIMELCIASILVWRALDPGSQIGFECLFTRPASTRLIVGVRFGFAVAVNTALYTLTALAAWWVYAPDFPVAGGAAVVALCSAILACALWSPATQAGRGLGAIVGLGLVFGLFGLLNVKAKMDQPFVMAVAAPEFFQLDFALGSATIVGVLTAFAITCFCVSAQRCGEILSWESWCNRLFQRCRAMLGSRRTAMHAASPAKRATRPFASARQAQYWCEFRTHGLPVAVVASVLGCLGLLIGGITLLTNPHSHIDVLWFVALMLGPLGFQLISADGASNVKAQGGIATYSPFYGTVPLSNQQLVRIKLISIALHTMLGFLILAACMSVHFTIFGWNRIAGIWPALVQLAEHTTPLWWISAIALLVWTFVSSSGMTLSIGYLVSLQTKRFWALAAAVYFHGIALFLLAAEQWPYVAYWSYYVYALALAITIFGCRNIYRSLRERQLQRSSLAIGLGLWIAYLAGLMFLSRQIEPEMLPPLPILILALSVLTVPLVGLLTVPSSLAQHRHA